MGGAEVQKTTPNSLSLTHFSRVQHSGIGNAPTCKEPKGLLLL